MTADYYRVLGIASDADAAEVAAAYRRLARTFHPDLNPSPEAEVRMRELNEAHAVLRSPSRRASYDRELLESVRVSQAANPTRARPSGAVGAVVRTARRTNPRSAAREAAHRSARAAHSQQRASVRVRRFHLVRNLSSQRRAIGIVLAAAVALTAIGGAVGARLFEGAGGVSVTRGAGSVVLVTQTRAAEEAAAPPPRATPTAQPWPPFGWTQADRGSEAALVDGQSSALGLFLSRAGRAVESRLAGPTPPEPPVQPTTTERRP